MTVSQQMLRFLVGGSIPALLFLVSAASPASAEIRAYISAPDAVTTGYGSVITNGFDTPTFALQTYNSPVTVAGFGTYQFGPSNQAKVTTDDQYGSGTGAYLGLGQFWTNTNNTLALDFVAPVRYFGISWSAGDSGNDISFYTGGNLIATYSTSQISSVLTPTTVTAVNGASYNTADYKGKPGTGENVGENYTYINFFGIDQSFDRVVFSNSANTGFESDNHSISFTTQTPNGTFVPAGFIGPVAIPEAETLPLVASALTLLGGSALLRRKKPS
jgi:hypothetical protein